MFNLIDLFCGCGGYSAGFVLIEKSNWQVKLGIDDNKDAINTFNLNIPDVGEVNNLTIVKSEKYLSKLGLREGELDLLHASPPCELYSCNNRINNNPNDVRFQIVLNWIEVFQPKFVSIENVDGFSKVHSITIKNKLKSLGYQVEEYQINSAQYGVPQFRKRTFYLAAKDKSITLKKPIETHGTPNAPWINAYDAIGDLPPRYQGQDEDTFVSELRDERMNSYLRLIAAPLGDIVTEHKSRKLSKIALKRIMSLKPGEAISNLPLDLRPKSGFRGAYGRINPKLPSKTITTGIRGPSHGPFSHYSQDRLITLREAARLQSFPDSFLFSGGSVSKASQIGNAVPPLVAKAFKTLIESYLK